MPYITEERKALIAAGAPRENAGELTYVIQQELRRYIAEHKTDYQTMAECLGALEGAKLDLYVRVIEPYEEQKRQDNGDVW